MTQSEYDELVSSFRACDAVGYDGFKRFYDELLEDHRRRRTLPLSVERRLDEEDEIAAQDE